MLAAAWGGSILVGGRALLEHEATPGAPAIAPSDWPQDAKIQRKPGHSTILLFAHPECPCTAATLGNLSALLTDGSERSDVWVVFDLPASGWKAFQDSPYRKSAGAIPGVHVVDDAGGKLTRLFGAQTSGQIIFYGPAGRKLFSGGITASRAHEGESEGAAILRQLMRGLPTSKAHTPVYGCALIDSNEASTELK